MRSRAKWGARAFYYVPPFKFEPPAREEIEAVLGSDPPGGSVEQLEEVVGQFVADAKHTSDGPTLANIKAALEELAPKVRELAKLLGQNDGLDYRTRMLIVEGCVRYVKRRTLLKDCHKHLWDLSAVIEVTRRNLDNRGIPKGRPRDPKRDLTRDVASIMDQHGVKPTAGRGGAFERVLALVLAAAGEAVGDEHVHRLARAALTRTGAKGA